MKTIKLQGGLGNQMFQYAVTRALEKETKDIYLDTSFFEKHSISNDNFTAREYELSLFPNLRAKVLTERNRQLLFSEEKRFRFLRKTLRKEVVEVKQEGNEFVEIPNYRNLYLDGYFQSEKYFQQIRSELLIDFEFPKLDSFNQEIKDKIASENAVSIHVRRGDYLKPTINEHHGTLSLNYYKEALQLLQSRTTEALTFYVFSDDKDYIEENFNFLPNKTLVSCNTGTDSWKDMCLMSFSKHHIIANSSFSWWGAWLSNKKGLTLAPSKWFNDEKVSYEISNFIPENWLIIDI